MKLTITTKHKANKILLDSLFNPINGKTLTHGRYDMGKYSNPCIGKEVEAINGVYALYTEKRKDKDGAYYALFCLSSN